MILIRKKKFILLFIFLLGHFSYVLSQNSGLGQNDPVAKSILDAVTAHFNKINSLKVNFIFDNYSRNKQLVGSQKGTILVDKKRFKLTQGNNLIIVSDGTTVWRIDKESKEITISTLDNSAETITPQKLFGDFYDKDFLYKKNGTINNVAEIELTPMDKRKPFFKVYLYINTIIDFIVKAKILQKDGTSFVYSFSDTTSPAVTDADFAFSAKDYPGFDVIDNR